MRDIDPKSAAQGEPFLGEGRMADRVEGEARSIGTLIKDLRDDTVALFKQELTLAKTEMSEKANKFARNGAYLGVGAAVAFSGLMFLLVSATCLLIVLMRAMDIGPNWYSWLAPLIVALAAAGVGYGLVQKAINTLKKESLVPEKTLDTLQENKEWIASKTSK